MTRLLSSGTYDVFEQNDYIVTISYANGSGTRYYNIYTDEISETLSDVEMTDDELDDYISVTPGLQEPGEEESGEKV